MTTICTRSRRLTSPGRSRETEARLGMEPSPGCRRRKEDLSSDDPLGDKPCRRADPSTAFSSKSRILLSHGDDCWHADRYVERRGRTSGFETRLFVFMV